MPIESRAHSTPPRGYFEGPLGLKPARQWLKHLFQFDYSFCEAIIHPPAVHPAQYDRPLAIRLPNSHLIFPNLMIPEDIS